MEVARLRRLPECASSDFDFLLFRVAGQSGISSITNFHRSPKAGMPKRLSVAAVVLIDSDSPIDGRHDRVRAH